MLIGFYAVYSSMSAVAQGGILSVTKIIFDLHFQRRGTVLQLAGSVGFREQAFFGNRIAYTLNLEKPHSG